MKRLALVLALGLSLAAGGSARAAEKCPYDVQSCLDMYARMRERPWLGIEFDIDSTGVPLVVGVLEDSPAEHAGVRSGDRVRAIDGQSPRDWFAGKSGWHTGGTAPFTVDRGKRERVLKMELRPISEERLARMIGAHMIEGHFAHNGNKPIEGR